MNVSIWPLCGRLTRCTTICLVQRWSTSFSNLGNSSLCWSVCSTSQCISTMHCDFCHVVPWLVWLWCIVVHIKTFCRSHTDPPGSLYFFFPTQINFLHLIKDVPCRLSGICLLSPAFSPFSLPSLSLLSFPSHVFTLMSKLIASLLLYRILESFCTV